jgi:hypothetical protein
MGEGLGEWDDELFYPNVAEFVREKLAVTYRRPLNVQSGVTWCPNGGGTPKPSAASTAPPA